MVSGLYNGVVSWITSIPGKLVDMKNSIVSTVRNIDLKEIGANVVHGFINGIGSMLGRLTSKVDDIASTVKNKLNSAFNIHSPSRAMMELGGYVGQGLAIGIDETKSLVSKANLGLAEASNFANDFSSVNGSIPINNQSKRIVSPAVSQSGKGGDVYHITNDFTFNVNQKFDDNDINRVVKQVHKSINNSFSSKGRSNIHI